MRLVDNARNFWKWFSVQALAVLGIIAAVWPVLPPEAQALVPEPWRPWVLVAVAVGGIFGRVIDQSGGGRGA